MLHWQLVATCTTLALILHLTCQTDGTLGVGDEIIQVSSHVLREPTI